MDEDLQDVDLNLAIGTYGQSGMYEDSQPRIDEATLIAVQQQMAQQAAYAQVPDVVKRVSTFHFLSTLPLIVFLRGSSLSYTSTKPSSTIISLRSLLRMRVGGTD